MTKRTFLSTLLGLFALASNADQSPKAVAPPVDLNVPITNPRLVAAIFKHQRLHTNDTATELYSELKNSFLLVPVILDKPTANTTNGQKLFKKGEKIAVIEVRDNSETRLLALFTDHDELHRFTDKANSTFIMPTKDAMSFVLDKGYSGFVVNPSGEATLRLDAPFIRTVIGGM